MPTFAILFRRNLKVRLYRTCINDDIHPLKYCLSHILDSNRRQFRLKFDTGAEAIAQIPLSGAGPAKLVTASEVATMDYVRNILNVPVPRVLAYSSDASSTPVGAEFVIKDITPGTSFDDRIRAEKGPWPTTDMIHLCDQVIEYEAAFLRARFAYHGSIFYKEDVSPDLQANPLYHVSCRSLHSAASHVYSLITGDTMTERI